MASSPQRNSVTGPVSKVLIPAAGRGTRFLPLTKSVPKELAPIVTTPALQLVVEEAARTGVTDVLLVVSQEKGAIADYFSPNFDLESALEAKGDTATLEAVRRGAELANYPTSTRARRAGSATRSAAARSSPPATRWR